MAPASVPARFGWSWGAGGAGRVQSETWTYGSKVGPVCDRFGWERAEPESAGRDACATREHAGPGVAPASVPARLDAVVGASPPYLRRAKASTEYNASAAQMKANETSRTGASGSR